MDEKGETPLKLIVVGCGNDFAGDDGAGPELVRHLAMKEGATGMQFHYVAQPGVELLETLAPAEAVLFVDAIVGAGPAGTVILAKLPGDAVVARNIGSLSTHGWGMDEMVNLASALARPLPPMALLGIEIHEALPGGAVSEPVKRAIEDVVARFDKVREQLDELLHGDGSEIVVVSHPPVLV